jgi:prevent-host-death family protein
MRIALPEYAILTRLGLIEGNRMKPVNIYEAKTRFSQLVDKAAAGEDVIVSRNGKPLVRITRLANGEKQRIKFGVLKGKVKIAADFDAPLPHDVLAAFEGR